MKTNNKKENKKLQKGDRALFTNLYAYPTISGRVVTIQNLPDKEFDYYGVMFEDGSRMAAKECELTKLNY